jgi:cobalt/nickel transport system permease protein
MPATTTGPGVPENAAPGPAKRSAALLWLGGLFATVLLAGVVSYYASASPDGLEKVAVDHGINSRTEEHASRDSPLADYQTKNVDGPGLSGGLAGVIGVVATLGVGSGLFWLVRRGATTPDTTAPDTTAPGTTIPAATAPGATGATAPGTTGATVPGATVPGTAQRNATPGTAEGSPLSRPSDAARDAEFPKRAQGAPASGSSPAAESSATPRNEV